MDIPCCKCGTPITLLGEGASLMMAYQQVDNVKWLQCPGCHPASLVAFMMKDPLPKKAG